jgi:tetratricopeptide (TPR) repeat protein
MPAMSEAAALLQESGRHEEALAWALRWCQLEPSPDAQLAVAQAAYLAGRHEAALQALDALLARQPGHAAALQGRAFILLAQGHAQQALAGFDAALACGATGADPLMGRAQALRGCGRLEEALAATDPILATDPGHRAALAERIGLLIDLFRLDEAEALLDRALSLYPEDPDLRWGRATVRLQSGNLEGGWADHEMRYLAPTAGLKSVPPDYGVPTWTGAEDLRGRSILVLAELGLGDCLQFVRYVPLLQERGASVTLTAIPALHGLLQDSLPGVRVADGGQVDRPDYQVLLLSLPLAFGTTLATVPARMPYLRSRPELRAAWEQRLGPPRGLRVGLAWSGTTLFRNDARRWRSIPLELVRTLDMPGVEFVSLQKEVRDDDRLALQGWPALSHHGDELRTFAETAALVDLMDLVISVDTSVAHLAGGLNRPMRVLLPHNPDWRWFLHREDSPWYPSARLYRQPTPGDWVSVLARVRADLAELRHAG